MYLKSLVLKGFKSFADRSALVLEPGITAIVGPNGSGKSNISDAVLWVLGERNAKNLRGQVMEDVIFSGSADRKSVSLAQVDLVLDNSQGELPVDFDEVCISRRMYRSGESEYMINGSQVRRMDIVDILHDSGLGTGTHSIISQGHLDSILQSRPIERRALIEEAAGVLKHKQRKEKSQRKIEQMDQHLLRVKDIVSEVERQLGPLERKAKRARASKEAQEQLARIALSLAVDDLRTLQAKWELSTAQEGDLVAQVERALNDIAQADEKSEAIQAQLQEQTSSAVALANKARRISEFHQRLDSGLALMGERKRSVQGRIADLQMKTAAYAQDGQTSLLALAQDKELQETLEQKARAEAFASVCASEHAQAIANTQEAEARAFDLLKRRQQSERDLSIARRGLSEAVGMQKNNANKLEMQRQQQSRYEADKEAALNDEASAVGTAASKEEEFAQASALETQARQTLADLEQRRDEARREYEAQNEAYRALEIESKVLVDTVRRASLNAGDLYNALLKDDSPVAGQIKPFIDDVSVQHDYETIVEALLGFDVNALVVPDDGCIAEVDALARRGGHHGSVSVLRRDAKGKAMPSPFDRLIDHVFCSNESAAYVEAFLGDVLVADTLSDALEIAKQAPYMRVIARGGDIVWPNGKVTIVGNPDTQTMGLISAKQRLAYAQEQCQKAKDLASSAKESMLALDEQIRTARKESLDAASAVARIDGERSALAKAKKTAQDAARRATERLESSTRIIADLEKAIATSKPKAEEFRNKVHDAESALKALDKQSHETQEILNPLRTTQDEKLQALSEAKLAVARLEERCKLLKKTIIDTQSEAERRNRQNMADKQELARQLVILERIDAVMPLIEQISRASERQSRGLDTRIVENQGQTDSQTAAAAAARNEARQARELHAQLSEQLAQVRVEKGRLEVQVSSAVKAITQDCQVSLEVAVQQPALEDREAAEEEAARLRKRVASLGNVNMDAVREYDEVRTRYDYLHGQLDDLTNARAAIKHIDAAIEKKMKLDFERTFVTVDENFQEIFAELFPAGHAHLELVGGNAGEEPGVEVVAQPAGKKITKMSLMSGGEKSLVAMALLFAVYKTRTTPFYILDEVEAALDDTNLRRLCVYLDVLRESTQLIMITHQRRTMEMADVLFGVSMQNNGVTKVISQKLERALKYAED